MSTNVANPSVSINPQALAFLKKLLDDLKAKPPSLKTEDWNLSQLVAAKSSVIPRYGAAFSSATVGKLSRETFLEFLQFENNLHWRGLQRHGNDLTKNMDRLRAALALLVDESEPLKDRLERLRPRGGRSMVTWLGPATLTAILHVVYPDRYGVLNNILKPGMAKVGLWPRDVPEDSFPDLYLAVNEIFLELASQLGIDLWTLDYFWWYLAPPTAPRSLPVKASEPSSGLASSAREVPALGSAPPRVEATTVATISSPVMLFDHDDPGYLAWLAANRGGFVINCNSKPVASYLVLHRATCTWINPPRFRNWTTVGYIKVCAPTSADLDVWTQQATGGHPKPCPSCMKGGDSRRDGTRVERAGSDSPTQATAGSISTAPDPSAPVLSLPSGLLIVEPLARLLAFCREEFAYYDGIADQVPARIEPIDVLATVAMNSRVNEASLIRTVHRGLAGRCDSLLARIPVNADLMTYDPELTEFRNLIHAAVQAPQVLVAVATKVLHRKRRNFIPMLDSFVIKHYAIAMKRLDWIEKSQSKATAAAVAVEVLKAFREDLRHAFTRIAALRTSLANAGFDVTPVRILEVLVWTGTETNRYYRTG